MSKTVTFSLSFLQTLDDWEIKKNSFYERSKSSRPTHSLLDAIFNHCLNSTKVKSDNEIDQTANTKQKSTHKRAILRFLNEKKNELQLGYKTNQVKRRSRNSLSASNTSPPKKQTRYQAQLCSSDNCEWKQKYEAEVEENSILKNEINSLKMKMEEFQSQPSTQKSSQSQPWATSIQLLQSEQIGCITRYSVSMIRLAIFLLVACNLSARSIPLVLFGILNAAEFKNLKLPKYGFFTKIRSMLPNLNKTRMMNFCSNAKELCLCFDGSSFSTQEGGIFALSMMNEEAENHLIAMIEHNEKAENELQHVYDVRLILQKLQNIFGDSFDTIISKVTVILSDDSVYARQTRKHLRDELDRLYPNEFARSEKRCLIHVANLAEAFILRQLPLLAPFLRKLAPTFSKPKNASTDSLYNVWTGHKVIYAHGSRFFVHGTNAVSAFASFTSLSQLLTRYQRSSINAAQLLEMTKKDGFYAELAVMARLSTFVHNIWSMITVKQTRRSLIENIEKIKGQIELVENDIFTLDEVAEHLVPNHQVDRDAYQKYVSEFAENEAVQLKVKEVFLHFTQKLLDLMEQYLEIEDIVRIDEETDPMDMVVDPTNLGVERSFAILKFFEKRFIGLSFGCLSALTIAKFNNLPRWLENFSDDKLLDAHRSIRTNQSLARDDHSVQENHIQMNTKRRLDKVIILD